MDPELNSSPAHQLCIGLWVLTSTSTIVVAVRLYSRIAVMKRFDWADGLIVVAAVRFLPPRPTLAALALPLPLVRLDCAFR